MTSIMKRESDLHSIILMATVVQCNVCMIGSISLARWLSIISAEYTSLKEQTQVAHGIKTIDIYVVKTIIVLIVTIISSLMIYLVNADQSPNNNTMMTT